MTLKRLLMPLFSLLYHLLSTQTETGTRILTRSSREKKKTIRWRIKEQKETARSSEGVNA